MLKKVAKHRGLLEQRTAHSPNLGKKSMPNVVTNFRFQNEPLQKRPVLRGRPRSPPWPIQLQVAKPHLNRLSSENGIKRLAQRCQLEPHLYIKFYGD
jgi:hypothetical protein